MKASFGSRLAAYIIDFIILSIIISIVCYALPIKDNTVEKEINDLSNKLVTGEINSNEYISKYKDLLYKNNKNKIVENTVTVALTIAYFVLFQYMNKGQTVGKKLLHIRVVNADDESSVSILKGFLRSLVILNLLSSLVAVGFVSINKNTYITIYLTMMELETILLILSALFVLYRKDGRGLHDMLAHTKVIKEEV